jgi:hypothetical protein
MQLESRRADDTTPLVGSGRKSLLGTIATYFMMAALIVVIVILSVIAARYSSQKTHLPTIAFLVPPYSYNTIWFCFSCAGIVII